MELLLDLESLRRAITAGAAPTYRFFWGHRARADGRLSDSCFSQWWPCRFTSGGDTYASAEHFMMAGKARLFRDEEAREAVLRAADPASAKAIGRKVRDFDATRWEQARFDLVTAGNVAKFGSDPALGAYLDATGDALLVEASPRDRIWGIGLGASNPRALDPRLWRGLNLLGFALVRTRAILRGELPEPRST